MRATMRARRAVQQHARCGAVLGYARRGAARGARVKVRGAVQF
jgi:hypothetical protein